MFPEAMLLMFSCSQASFVVAWLDEDALSSYEDVGWGYG